MISGAFDGVGQPGSPFKREPPFLLQWGGCQAEIERLHAVTFYRIDGVKLNKSPWLAKLVMEHHLDYHDPIGGLVQIPY
jgi:hypothetical protein